jgi:hypothetical protein
MFVQKIVPARTITIHPNYVTKQDLPELMSVEVEKTRKAREIGRACGLFRVPEVLDYNPATGKARLERIDNIRSIGSVFSYGRNCDELMARVGKALATIHNELKLSSNMVIELPSEWKGPETTNVFIHGDFNIMNVSYDVNNDKLVILDWQMTKIWGGRATFGTRFFDITWFIHTMFFQPFYKVGFYMPATHWATIFLRNYSNKSKYLYDEASFRSYLRKGIRNVAKSNKKRLPLYKFVFYYPALIRFRLFIDAFRLC